MKSSSLILKIVVFILFLGQLTFAQSTDNVLDSLQNILGNTNNAEKKAHILLQMGNRIRITASLSEAEKYIEQALTIAKEQHNQELIAEISMEKGKIQAEKGNNDEAEKIFLNALKVYEQLDDELNILNCLNGLGIISRRKGDYIQSVQYFEKAMTYFSERIPAKNKGNILTNLSTSYLSINKYSLAYEMLFEGLKYYEEANFTHGIGLLYGNLGSLYKNQNDFDNAIKYYEKSLEVVKKEGDLRGQAMAYRNMGIVYSAMDNHSKAIEFSKKELAICKKMESESLIFKASTSLVSLYLKLDQLEEAETVLNQLQPNENISAPDIRGYYSTRASIFYKRKQYSKAVEAAEKAYVVAQELGDYRYQTIVLKQLHVLCQEQGNINKAYQYLKEYKTVSDSLKNQSNVQELTTQAMQFEFDKTTATYELEKKALESNLRTQRIIRWAAILVALLIGIIAMIAYRNSKRKNELLTEDLKNKKTIEAQNQLLRATQQTIEAQSAELQVLYDYKNKLFANIAHELRTPLTLISNPVKAILQSGTIAEKDAKQLRIVDRNVRSLSSSIYQILDLAKRENIELVAQPISFDVNRLVRFIASDFRSMAQFKSIHFTKPPISAAIPVITDGEKLMIVIRNLLSNAFKFTPKAGQVNIHIMDLGEEVAISVQDTGQGISAENLEKIFNRHFQVNPANLPSEGGMGIGLAICKEYMTLINGKIYAESQLGQGSTFSIRFPKKISKTVTIDEKANQIFNALITPVSIQNIQETQQKELVSTGPLTATETTNEVTTILIVEDNVDMSNYLMSILSEEHELYFTQDGQEALQFLENRENPKPDLIISDYMMPNMNGLELMSKLKSHNDYAHIPVVMLTAQQAVDIKLDALRIGVDDYLTKPFDNRELVARVDNILTNQRIIKAEQQREQIENHPKNDSTTSLNTNLEDLEWLTTLEENALKYVYNLDFTLNQLADEMAMSYSGLFPKIKKLTGMTPNQYITELRFQEARKLLEARKYGSVKAVAYSVGYKSVKHFSKNFKKRFGKSPSAYLQ